MLEPGVPRSYHTKVNKTPEWLCEQLAPPGATIHIGFLDHRFTSTSKLDASSLASPYCQKTFSQSFVYDFGEPTDVKTVIRLWPQALENVHRFNWEKWQKLKHLAPLPAGKLEQKPGKIPAAIMKDVGAVLKEKLREKTSKYAAKKSG